MTGYGPGSATSFYSCSGGSTGPVTNSHLSINKHTLSAMSWEKRRRGLGPWHAQYSPSHPYSITVKRRRLLFYLLPQVGESLAGGAL